MHLIINGKDTNAEPGTTLEMLLEQLLASRSQKGVAVAVNDAVVPRNSWGTRRLQAGDRVEIIRAVQGG